MSRIDYRSKRSDNRKATKLVRDIVVHHRGNISFSAHSREELKNDRLTMNDVMNVLCSTAAKILMPGELRNGSYTYQWGTSNIVVVIAFWPNGKGLNVVTVWRRR